MALQLRARSKLVVSFGDCSVSANVPGLRNLWAGVAGGSRQSVLDRGYVELADRGARRPHAPGIVPELLERVLPLHEVIAVDHFLPGCPPSAERIKAFLEALLRGEAGDGGAGHAGFWLNRAATNAQDRFPIPALPG